ncbi:DUF6366 family protein [Salisediminibacterium beveridgei]|uniref:Uncharacterized protein n=1 Tax=Salisediminibacterium beveridgei TaxID=632773 RepID=A0A1D7QZ39_9BACI|nr:DUF6366 family protein [Salisediminibacterium beveridgei]AOM84271.1 hypothetical protein BBEV_2946 [Salisediminibacterium beveridgei]
MAGGLNQETVNELMKDGYTLYKQGKKREAAEVWLILWELIQEEMNRTDVSDVEDIAKTSSNAEMFSSWLDDLKQVLAEVDGDPDFMREQTAFLRSGLTVTCDEGKQNQKDQESGHESDKEQSKAIRQKKMQEELARQMNTLPPERARTKREVKAGHLGDDAAMTKQQSNHDRQERQRQKELQDNPGGGLRDGADRAGSGGLVDLVNALGAKGIGILILVLLTGYLIYALFIQ